jgi:hypothetical protein
VSADADLLGQGTSVLFSFQVRLHIHVYQVWPTHPQQQQQQQQQQHGLPLTNLPASANKPVVYCALFGWLSFSCGGSRLLCADQQRAHTDESCSKHQYMSLLLSPPSAISCQLLNRLHLLLLLLLLLLSLRLLSAAERGWW